eukprot:jgi/Hompol1/5093/HPOL_000489-RA
MESEFLRIDKSDYLEIATVRDLKHLEKQLRILNQIPDFQPIAEQANTLVEMGIYEANETIIYEGTQITKIHWIVSGSCRCVKVIPFVQRTTQIGFEKATRQLRAHDGVTPCAADEEILETPLTIQELENWDHFPGLPIVTDVNDYTFNREIYIKSLEDANGVPTLKAEYSVFSTSKVEIASIAIADYLRLAPVSLILEVLRGKNLVDVSTTQLQEAYLEKRKWETYKKSVVNQVQKSK